MKQAIMFILSCILSFGKTEATADAVECEIHIIGGGIVGALESYYAYKDALKKGKKICITVYEKGDNFALSAQGKSSMNTAYNIFPSLTPDEILSVVPRGAELVNQLALSFNQPGGIRVDDVVGVNDSETAVHFIESVTHYASDKNQEERTSSLLMLGKASMELWQQMYDEGDIEMKSILKASNFHACYETEANIKRTLNNGYRIDLIYGIPNARNRALKMQADYEKLGYENCALLSPDEVMIIDPYLTNFCYDRSDLDSAEGRIWKNDSIALWRPGGCIDTHVFLPQLYSYLKKIMGQYKDMNDHIQDCFQIQFCKEVIAVDLDLNSDHAPRVVGLKFSDGTEQRELLSCSNSQYLFCPGESVGSLCKFGFNEPAYAGFAGTSLFFNIPLPIDQMERYSKLSHCMEVHNEGIVLAWQARCKENNICIGVGGTKSFYGDKQPMKDEAFAKDRNLIQLNMVNQVFPEAISLACGYSTHGKEISAEEMLFLEERGIIYRWVGRRAVAYDGYPTIGPLYYKKCRVSNARCTTHLGSGGVSFGPVAVIISRSAEENVQDSFFRKVLKYADSRRSSD